MKRVFGSIRIDCRACSKHPLFVLPKFFPKLEENQALLFRFQLNLSYQFGDVWGWEVKFTGSAEEPMVYLIQLQKKDGNIHLVIHPFARESLGVKEWGSPLWIYS